ncbi:MAG: hypothetical protein ACREEM_34445 [Blastocatellia bacterium]
MSDNLPVAYESDINPVTEKIGAGALLAVTGDGAIRTSDFIARRLVIRLAGHGYRKSKTKFLRVSEVLAGVAHDSGNYKDLLQRRLRVRVTGIAGATLDAES